MLRFCLKVLVKQIPFFLHAPIQAYKNLDESISGCHQTPDKLLGEPISLLRVPFKILERFVYARIELIIDQESYLKSKLDFDAEDRPQIKSLFRLKKLKTRHC